MECWKLRQGLWLGGWIYGRSGAARWQVLTHLGRNVQYHQLTYAGVADQTVFVDLAMSCRLMSPGKVMVEKLLKASTKERSQ